MLRRLFSRMVAASILRATGLADVRNVAGGMDAWSAHGLPLDYVFSLAGAEARPGEGSN